MTLSNKLLAAAATILAATVVDLSHANPAFSKQNQCTKDQYRPRYHFSPSANWINDPNGMVYYDGTYHLFYQYHPFSMEWGPMHWGHAVSKNLVTWQELDVALEPDEVGEIFSGSSVVDTLNTTGLKPTDSDIDPIVAIYTSATGEKHEIQRQSLAFSLDKGMTFQKFEGNPVLVKPEAKDFRDPKVISHNGKWIMSLAVGDKIEFYSSPNLKEWKPESEFGTGEGSHDGVWECPDLIPLNIDISDKLTIEQWVLLVSINPGGPNKGSATQYFVGDFTSNSTYQTNPWKDSQWLDWGPDNYAGVTFANEPNGRFIYLGWMSNWIYAASTPTSTWRGQMTIPRELSLRVLNHDEKQYRLVSTPIKELEGLRNNLQYLQHGEKDLGPASDFNLTEKADFRTPTMELEITLDVENNPGFAICASNSLKEEVCFGLNQTSWYLDRQKSGNVDFHTQFSQTLHATAAREFEDREISVRIFLDVSSIEVFADGGVTTMTALIYPSEPLDQLYIKNWSPASSVKIKNARVWGLQCWFTEEENKTPAPGSGGVRMGNAGAFTIVLSALLLLFKR